jgi:outer membrane biosynthesis protein TonB
VGEIEMALGNRQLLSVFFIVVALLGIFFTVGYIVGRSASPVLADSSRRSAPPLVVNSIASQQAATAKAAAEAKPQKKAAVPQQTPNAAAAISRPEQPSAPHPSAAHAETVKTDAVKTEPLKSETVKTGAAPQESAKKEPAKSELPKNETSQNRSSAPTNPGAAVAANGQSYLQLTATSKTDADKMVDVLRQKGFSTIAVEIRERPGTWRVMVGPVSDSGANLRADLQKMGFPGNDALRRTF